MPYWHKPLKALEQKKTARPGEDAPLLREELSGGATPEVPWGVRCSLPAEREEAGDAKDRIDADETDQNDFDDAHCSSPVSVPPVFGDRR